MLRTPPTFVPNAHIADVEGSWLALTCCLQRLTYVPLRLLAGATHPTARLRDVLRRMRCKDCHDRPVAVMKPKSQSKKPVKSDEWIARRFDI